VIARKKGEEWFIGGINGASATKLDINFSFLDHDKVFSAKIYSDDPSVDTRTHVRIDSMRVDRSTVFPVSLNPDNGIAMHIKPRSLTTSNTEFKYLLGHHKKFLSRNSWNLSLYCSLTGI